MERRIIMKKIYGVITLAAMLLGATLLLERTAGVAAPASPSGIKNVVLVHGAFADGSGWETHHVAFTNKEVGTVASAFSGAGPAVRTGCRPYGSDSPLFGGAV